MDVSGKIDNDEIVEETGRGKTGERGRIKTEESYEERVRCVEWIDVDTVRDREGGKIRVVNPTCTR